MYNYSLLITWITHYGGITAIMDILLVEDDLNILQLYEAFVVMEGHQPYLAATIAAARTLLLKRRFDMCVTDFHVGHMNVLDMLWHLPYTSQIPARTVVISGSSEASKQCEARGIEFHTKPMSLARFRAILRNEPFEVQTS